MSVLGSIVLDVDGPRLDARFIDNLGVTRDYFTMVKSSEPQPPPTIETASVPNATVGVPYSTTLVASGGVQPYAWTISAGALPSGLTLSPAGTIAGTPSGAPASYSFTARVQASDNQFATRGLTLQLLAAPAPLPGAFAKTAPKNNAKNTATALTLSWGASANATSYQVLLRHDKRQRLQQLDRHGHVAHREHHWAGGEEQLLLASAGAEHGRHDVGQRRHLVEVHDREVEPWFLVPGSSFLVRCFVRCPSCGAPFVVLRAVRRSLSFGQSPS